MLNKKRASAEVDVQLIFEQLELKSRLLNTKNAVEAFNFVFSPEYLNYAYDHFVGLKRTRGVDGVTLRTFESNKKNEIQLISSKVKNGGYRFTPYLEILKSKGRGKVPRVLSNPTVRDKLALFCLKDFLQYLYQGKISKLHPNEHVSRLCNVLKKDTKIQYFYRGDLKDFYPSIPRDKLLHKLRERFDYAPFLKLAESALKAPTKPLSAKGPPQTGVPQGLSISNILADIYLVEFDEELKRSGAFCGRFVDDIVFAGRVFPLIKAWAFLKIWLKKRQLTLSKDKSSFGSFAKGIDYLGYHIKRRKDESIYVGVRKASQEKLVNSICGLFTSYKHSEDRKHLYRLNRRITGVIWKNKRYGWLFYFSELNDLTILRRFDSVIADLKQRMNISTFDFKKFTNSYWRIKKGKWGGYITNFDEFTIDEMKSYLMNATDMTMEDIEKLSFPLVQKLFSLEVQKEIDRMEQDVGDIS